MLRKLGSLSASAAPPGSIQPLVRLRERRYTQTKQILQSFAIMLESVDSDLNHVVHINIFLKDMRDFDRMNQAYSEMMGVHRPARTVIGVNELPKPGVLLTMNLTAVTREPS